MYIIIGNQPESFYAHVYIRIAMLWYEDTTEQMEQFKLGSTKFIPNIAKLQHLSPWLFTSINDRINFWSNK